MFLSLFKTSKPLIKCKTETNLKNVFISSKYFFLLRKIFFSLPLLLYLVFLFVVLPNLHCLFLSIVTGPNTVNKLSTVACCSIVIEDEWNQKTRQRLSRLFGGQNSCHASCFAQVYLEQKVESNRLFEIDRLSSTVCSK